MNRSECSVAVSTDQVTACGSAQAYAARLGLPWVEWGATGHPLLLRVTLERLELLQCSPGRGEGVFVDFSGGIAKARRQEGLKQALARAVGVKPGIRPLVLDATPGLGRDAFVLAALGCRVILVERSLVVHALLADGLQRAHQAGLPEAERMTLLFGDARDHLIGLTDPAACPDVIYLDPMHPERGKSALVKKEMRHLRTLVGEDADAPALLPVARLRARQRVVVKRPRLASPLTDQAADAVIPGRSTRYDLYFKTAPAP